MKRKLSHTPWTPGTLWFQALAFALLLIGVVPAAHAQEDQAYKETFNQALSVAKEGQSAQNAQNYAEAADQYAAAYQQFREAASAAEQAGDNNVSQRATSFATQLAYRAGLVATRTENYQQALDHFQAGIDVDPNYAKNYLGRGKAYQDMNQVDQAIEAFAQAVEVGNESGDAQTAQTAADAIRSQYHYLASSRLGASSGAPSSADAQQALDYLSALQEYVDPTADTYYYMAVAHEALGQHDQAISEAEQAIELHRGSRTDAAKIYLIKGEALMKQGNNAEARQAFQNATYGEYKQRAEHYLEQLGT